MKFVLTLADVTNKKKSITHLVKDDIESSLADIVRNIDLGDTSGICKNKDGTSIGSWGLSTTSTSSYAVTP